MLTSIQFEFIKKILDVRRHSAPTEKNSVALLTKGKNGL